MLMKEKSPSYNQRHKNIPPHKAEKIQPQKGPPAKKN